MQPLGSGGVNHRLRISSSGFEGPVGVRPRLSIPLALWQELAEGHDPVVIVGLQKVTYLHMCLVF
jgi:hypothetical protein